MWFGGPARRIGRSLVRRMVLAVFVLVFAGTAAAEPPETERVRYVGAREAVELIRELRPEWHLAPNDRGKCGGSLYTADGGRYPGGLALGGYTLLAAPEPTVEELYLLRHMPMLLAYGEHSRAQRTRWHICLMDRERRILWETEAVGLLHYDLAATGTVAIAERAASHVVGARVFSSHGRILYSDVWLTMPPVIRPRGYYARGFRVLTFSPTGRWLVMSSAPAYDLEDTSGDVVRVFDCRAQDAWEIRLHGCDVTQAIFPGPDTVKFLCCPCDEDGRTRVLGPGEEHEARTLNLENRVLE